MEIPKKVKDIADIIADKKGQDIKIIYVADKTIVSDYFVITSASSSTLVMTIADELEAKTAEAGFPPSRIEGVREGRWAVLDFGDVLVHVFHNDEREFYQLERLWADDENCISYGPEA